MKKLLLLLLFIPLIASAQLDFESNKYKLDFVKLPEIESLLTTPLPLDTGFSKKISNKLPSFKMDKNNYREPVSMYDAMAASENYVKSDIKISLDPKEYGVYGNRSYNPDGSTKVKNIAYKDASRGFLFADSCPPYGVCPRCAPYRIHGY
jgi:hypothetical protein